MYYIVLLMMEKIININNTFCNIKLINSVKAHILFNYNNIRKNIN